MTFPDWHHHLPLHSGPRGQPEAQPPADDLWNLDGRVIVDLLFHSGHERTAFGEKNLLEVFLYLK